MEVLKKKLQNTQRNHSFIELKKRADFNQKQNVPDREVKFAADTFEGTVMTYQQKPKPNSVIEPDTMARIESMIEKRADGCYCTNCGYKTKHPGHMREHVEKHIEGLEYPCYSCNKIMRSSKAFREHKRKCII